MFIERPPLVYRLLYPGAVWRAASHTPDGSPAVYLTFDDGPTPAATPGVLDILERHSVPATFFMVADNARRYPHLADLVRSHGYTVGNHTTHHLQGLFTSTKRYIADVAEAESIVGPARLFRPPHGFMRPGQVKAIGRTHTVVMQDVVSRDYNTRLTPGRVVSNVLNNVRPGSIVVFHDSEKSARNVLGALEKVIEGLRGAGYKICPLDV